MWKNKTKVNQWKENWATPKKGPFHFHLIEDYFSGKEKEHNAYTLGEQSLKDLDFNDLWFSDDNNMCIIFWTGDIPECIKKINEIHEYRIYEPDEWMREIEIWFTGS